MKKYIRLSTLVHAFRWNGNPKQIDKYLSKEYAKGRCWISAQDNKTKYVLNIRNLEGIHHCRIGYFVIKDNRDELHICSPKRFKTLYKEIN